MSEHSHAVAGRAAARLARVIENVLSEARLSLPQYRMLIYLSEVGSSSAAPMAGRLGVSRPSITALADGLVARELADRTTDATDRRRVSHTITPLGVEALRKADAVIARRFAELAQNMPSKADQEAAYAGLLMWMEALNVERAAKLADQ